MTQEIVSRGSIRKFQLIASSVGPNPLITVLTDFRIPGNARRVALHIYHISTFALILDGISANVNVIVRTGDPFYTIDAERFGNLATASMVINSASNIAVYESFIEGEMP